MSLLRRCGGTYLGHNSDAGSLVSWLRNSVRARAARKFCKKEGGIFAESGRREAESAERKTQVAVGKGILNFEFWILNGKKLDGCPMKWGQGLG